MQVSAGPGDTQGTLLQGQGQDGSCCWNLRGRRQQRKTTRWNLKANFRSLKELQETGWEEKKKRKKKYYKYLGTGKPPEPLPCQQVPAFTNLWKKTPSASKSCVWVSLEGAPTALYPPENCSSIERLSEREAWLAEAFPNLPEQPLSLRAETTEVLPGWAWQIPWI